MYLHKRDIYWGDIYWVNTLFATKPNIQTMQTTPVLELERLREINEPFLLDVASKCHLTNVQEKQFQECFHKWFGAIL